MKLSSKLLIAGGGVLVLFSFAAVAALKIGLGPYIEALF